MAQAREGISDLGTLLGVRKRVTFEVTPRDFFKRRRKLSPTCTHEW